MRCLFSVVFCLVLLAVEFVKAQSQELLFNKLPQIGINAAESPYLIDALITRLQEPLDINQAKLTDLIWLGLPTKAAYDLIDYRSRYGQFESVNELHQVTGFDSVIVSNLLPYITCNGMVKLPTDWSSYRMDASSHWLQIRSRTSAALARSWPAQPTDQLIRYRYQGNSGLAIGFTLQQDAGELIRVNGKQWLADFTSGYVCLPISKRTGDQMIIGDFSLNTGHRLVFGNAFVGAFGQQLLPAEGYRTGFIPWTSAIENGFFRGLSATINRTITDRLTLQVLPMVSYCSQDSRQLWQDSLGMNSVIGLPVTGYHRTVTELAGRQQAGQLALGTSAVLSISNAEGFKHSILGFNALHTSWSAPLVLKNGAGNQRFNGQQVLNLSINGSHQFTSSYLSGEMAISLPTQEAYSLSDHTALSVEWIKALGKSYTFQIRGRHYGNAYYAPFGTSLGQTSAAYAERGLTMAIQRQNFKGWVVSFQSDLFQFTAPRFRLDKSDSWGHETGLAISRLLGLYTKVRGSLRYRRQDRNVTGFDDWVLPTNTTYTVAGIQHTWPSGIRTTHQLAGTAFYQTQMSYGWSMLHAANAQLTKQIGLAAFLLLYHAGTFDARTYLVEPQILWYQQIPYLGGQGVRLGALANFKVSNGIRIDLKYAKVLGTTPDDQVWVQLLLNLAKVQPAPLDLLLW